MKLKRTCPICDCEDGNKLYGIDFAKSKSEFIPEHYDIVYCSNCGFIFSDTKWIQKDYDKYYSTTQKYLYMYSDKHGGVSEEEAKKYNKQIDRIEKYINKDANILEIIDHHNIGTIGTNMPISFRNMPVGSTNTIIYTLYKENRIDIPKNIAGLMLSGILSDTLILTSPTTTDIDREAACELSKIAGVDYKVYGYDMIRAGSSLEGMTMEQVLYKDYKTYTINNAKIGLGQVITTDIKDVLDKKDEYIELLNKVCEHNDYLYVCLFVTDILKNGTYVLYSDRAKEPLQNGFNIDNIKQGIFLRNVVSRKKQILPVLMGDNE